MQNTDEQIRKAVEQIFRQYDTDRSGSLEGNELTAVINDVFSAVGQKKKVSQQDVQKVLNAIDTNHDGKVSKDELFSVIKRCVSK